MWNLVFESLLKCFEDGFVKICGFADDAALVICGKRPDILMHRMQLAVNKALRWGETTGLSFSPSKTTVVLFTRKNMIAWPPTLKMGETASLL